jgi:L-methionine (R)-S-oxide reductase
MRIAMGKGVVGGTTAAQQKTMAAPDVHKFTDHIACDRASSSEVVVAPTARLSGVVDIDSPRFGRFAEGDRIGREAVAATCVAAPDA